MEILNKKIVAADLPINKIKTLQKHPQCNENGKIMSKYRLKKEPINNYFYTKDYSIIECIPCWLTGTTKLNNAKHVFLNVRQSNN